MFGLMKNIIKEAPPPSGAVTLAELHAGCVVGLGFMPQKSISGKRIPITEVNSYLFASDSFVVYRLVSEEANVNLIVADEEDPTGTYLALSQRIEPQLFDSLFAAREPRDWFAFKEGDTLKVNAPSAGELQGWLAASYTLVVSTGGRFLEGDWRLRKAADRAKLSRPFNYVLLVDEDNEFALEAEKHEDGTLQVFATVYRPATDIGEISRGGSKAAPALTHELPAEPARPVMPEVRAEPESLRPLVLVGPVETIPHESPLEGAKPAQDAQEHNTAAETKAAEPAVTHEPPVAKKEEPGVAPAAPAIAEEVKPEPVSLPAAVTAEASKPEKTEVTSEFTLEVRPEEALLQAEVEEVMAAAADAAPDASDVKEEEAAPQGAPEISAALAATAEAAMSAEQAVRDASPVYSKFGRIQPGANQGEESDMLACDARLASLLIDEAQRNQMAISELIRKVIDLPARVQDKVLIPFALDPSESAELARRYHLSAGDMQGVKLQIVEELRRFAGEKA